MTDRKEISGRIANGADLAMIAKIHKIAYSRSHFTALLSEATLTRYYSAFLNDGTEIRLALSSGGAQDLLGFSVYGVGIPEKIAAFKKACAKDILQTSLRHPVTSVGKAVKVILARFRKKKPYTPADFLLLSIAVAQPMAGVGKLLLNEMMAIARERGHKIVGLYVNSDNIRAINAYSITGFRIKDLIDGQYYMEARTDI